MEALPIEARRFYFTVRVENVFLKEAATSIQSGEIARSVQRALVQTVCVIVHFGDGIAIGVLKSNMPAMSGSVREKIVGDVQCRFCTAGHRLQEYVAFDRLCAGVERQYAGDLHR